MSAQGLLLELAQRHGIEHGYHDIWGTWHALSADTARSLLGAERLRLLAQPVERKVTKEALVMPPTVAAGRKPEPTPRSTRIGLLSNPAAVMVPLPRISLP